MNLASNRSFLDIENLGDLGSGDPFNVSQHDASPFPRREPVDPFEKKSPPLFQAEDLFRVRRRVRGLAGELGGGAFGSPVVIVADVHGDAVKPSLWLGADGALMFEHPQEDFLGGILRIVQAPKQTVSRSKDHLVVSGDEFLGIAIHRAAQRYRQC